MEFAAEHMDSKDSFEIAGSSTAESEMEKLAAMHLTVAVEEAARVFAAERFGATGLDRCIHRQPYCRTASVLVDG